MSARRRALWLGLLAGLASCGGGQRTPTPATADWARRMEEQLELTDVCQHFLQRVEGKLPTTGPNQLRKGWAAAVVAPGPLCARMDQALQGSITEEQARKALARLESPALQRIQRLITNVPPERFPALAKRLQANNAPVPLERETALRSIMVVNGSVGMTVEAAVAIDTVELILPVIEEDGVTRGLARWKDRSGDRDRAGYAKTMESKLADGARLLLQDATDDDLKSYMDFYASDEGKAVADLRVKVTRAAFRTGLEQWLASLAANPEQKLMVALGWPSTTHVACPDAEGCRKQCESGVADACQALGVSWRTGVGTAGVDLHKALDFLTRGCSLKLASACAEQGEVAQQLHQEPGYAATARAAMEEACRGGDAYGCAVTRIESIREAASNKERALVMRGLQDAVSQCEENRAPVCMIAAWQYSEGLGVTADPARADALLAHGCDQQDAGSCRAWADRAYLGWGTLNPDPSAAHQRYARVCGELADMHACNNWGDMFETGFGAPRDMERARTLYQQACDHGAGAGCWSLGTLHRYGSGVPQNNLEAARLLEQGCKLGTAPACRALESLRHPKDPG